MTEMLHSGKRANAFAGGATPLPNVFVDELLPGLTGTQTKLLLVVLRQTRGWRDPKSGQTKERDWLSQSQLMRRTGRASAALASAIDALVQRGLLVVEAEDGALLLTANERRRERSRLFYRLGLAITEPEKGDATEKLKSEFGAKEEFGNGVASDRKSEDAQANTTTDTPNRNKTNNSSIWKLNQGSEAETNRLTAEQKESIERSKQAIRKRLATLYSATPSKIL